MHALTFCCFFHKGSINPDRELLWMWLQWLCLSAALTRLQCGEKTRDDGSAFPRDCAINPALIWIVRGGNAARVEPLDAGSGGSCLIRAVSEGLGVPERPASWAKQHPHPQLSLTVLPYLPLLPLMSWNTLPCVEQRTAHPFCTPINKTDCVTLQIELKLSLWRRLDFGLHKGALWQNPRLIQNNRVHIHLHAVFSPVSLYELINLTPS